jgi:hypothetical protein
LNPLTDPPTAGVTSTAVPARNAWFAVDVLAQLIDPWLKVVVVFPPEITISPSIHPKVLPTLTDEAPLATT